MAVILHSEVENRPLNAGHPSAAQSLCQRATTPPPSPPAGFISSGCGRECFTGRLLAAISPAPNSTQENFLSTSFEKNGKKRVNWRPGGVKSCWVMPISSLYGPFSLFVVSDNTNKIKNKR